MKERPILKDQWEFLDWWKQWDLKQTSDNIQGQQETQVWHP